MAGPDGGRKPLPALALAAALPPLVRLRDANPLLEKAAAGLSDEAGAVRQRIPLAAWLAAGLCLLAIIPLLYLGRHLTFIADEWTFIVERNFSGLSGWFRPHNEHWSTLLLLVYHALFRTVGLRSYLPYLVVLELLHAGSAFLLFWLVRRRAGDLIAIAAMLTLLLLGRGSENILWAFQMGFVGSVFCGLLALLCLDDVDVTPLRQAAASLALLGSLLFSGVGLFFCAAVTIELLSDAGRRHYLVVLALPAIAYLAWFVAFGAAAASAHRSPLSRTALLSLPSFVPFGIGSAIAGLIGLSNRWASATLAVAAALLTLTWARRGGVSSRTLGALAGLLSQYGLTALVRGQFGDIQAAEPRYVYIGAVFLILIAADALAGLRVSRSLATATAAAFLLLLAYSATHLRSYAIIRNDQMTIQQAQLRALVALRGSPSMQLDTLIEGSGFTPVTARQYFDAIDALGSPVPIIDPSHIGTLPAAPVDAMVRRLFAPMLSPASGSNSAGSCQTYLGAATANVDLVAASGTTVRISATPAETIGLTLTLLGPPDGPPDREIELADNSTVEVSMPKTESPINWHLRVTLPAGGSTQICEG